MPLPCPASAARKSSESAIFSLPAEWVDTAGEDERHETLRELRSDSHRLLVTILVGNNVVDVAIWSISTLLLIEHMAPGRAATVTTGVASFVVLVFGEIVPKSYGLGYAKRWSLTVAGPISVVERVLYPLVVAFDFITRRLNAVIGGDAGIESPYLDE